MKYASLSHFYERINVISPHFYEGINVVSLHFYEGINAKPEYLLIPPL